MPTITLPNNWKPRPYQMPVWSYLENGGKRAVEVAHRRWGKDDIALHFTATAAHQRVATYWHMLPLYGQGRKAIWEAVNPHTGKRRIDEAFPKEIRARTLDQTMTIEFKCGSFWHVVGSDNYDSVVGSPPAGIVFSEWALANPSAWPFLEPILNENGGWAFWIYTSRGKNHGFSTYQHALKRPNWFAEISPADKTGVFTAEQLEEARSSLDLVWSDQDEAEAIYQQEYHCSFTAPVIGSYYGKLLSSLEKAGKITSVPWNPDYPVWTAWDLGIDDMTAVWYCQQVGLELHIIDYEEHRNRGLTEIASTQVLRKDYKFARHFMPHDVDTREMTTAKTRRESLESIGLKPITVTPRLPVEDGINATRSLLPKCVFDGVLCEKGLDALSNYKKEYDEKKQTYRNIPLHDWASHGADAFRCLALNVGPKGLSASLKRQEVALGDYDPTMSHGDMVREQRRQESAGMDYEAI